MASHGCDHAGTPLHMSQGKVTLSFFLLTYALIIICSSSYLALANTVQHPFLWHEYCSITNSKAYFHISICEASSLHICSFTKDNAMRTIFLVAECPLQNTGNTNILLLLCHTA